MIQRWTISERAGAGVVTIQPNPPDAALEAEFELSRFAGFDSAEQISTQLLNPDREQAKALGRTLFDHLLVPGSRTRLAWDRLPPAKKCGIDLLVQAPQLRGIPWELLWDGQNVPLARVGGFFRRGAHNQAASPTGWPLKVLILQSTLDLTIAAPSEVRGLKRALRNFGRSIDIRLEESVPTKAH